MVLMGFLEGMKSAIIVRGTRSEDVLVGVNLVVEGIVLRGWTMKKIVRPASVLGVLVIDDRIGVVKVHLLVVQEIVVEEVHQL